MTSTTSTAAPKPPPRRKGTGPRATTGPTTARTEFLRQEAVRMRRLNMTCAEIGAELGVSRQRAHQLSVEAMDEVRAETFQEAIEWRHELTHEHKANLKRARELRDDADPTVAASGILRGTQVLKELGDLWGAHAPTKIASTNPDGSPVKGMPAVVFVPVYIGETDWEARAAVVLEQGEAAALALTYEGTGNGGATEASADAPRA